MAGIETWADGFGRWHASVPLTDSESDDAQTARQAILSELSERVANLAPERVHVERERVTLHGTAIYRETMPEDDMRKCERDECPNMVGPNEVYLPLIGKSDLFLTLCSDECADIIERETREANAAILREGLTPVPGAVEKIDPDTGLPIIDRMTCGTCGRSWNDAAVSGITPVPAGRCPFEYEHEEDDES